MKEKLGAVRGIELLVGPDAAEILAGKTEADFVLNALVGSAGLAPTLATLQAGKTLALANKESLVVGGELVMDLVKGEPERLLPVDSEHAALAMALRDERREDLKRVVITGSGGPFRGWTRSELARASVKEALAAPRVVDGPEDHDRFGDADEQGPRGDRGALPVRPRLLADPRPDPPRGHRARARRVPRREPPGRDGARRTCGCRSSWRSGGRSGCPTGVAPVPLADRHLTFEPVDREAFPAVDLAYRVGGLGLHVPRGDERRERGRRHGVPRGEDPAHPHRRDRAGDRRRTRARVDRLGGEHRARRPLGARSRRRDRRTNGRAPP